MGSRTRTQIHTYYYIIISCIFSHLSKSKSYIKKKHNIKSEIKLEKKNSSNNIFQTLRSSPFYKTRPVKLFGKKIKPDSIIKSKMVFSCQDVPLM